MSDIKKLLSDALLSDFVQCVADKTRLQKLLSASDEVNFLNIANSSVLQDFIGHVNTSLNSGKERVQGLLLLCHILDQCSTDVFLQYSQTWSNLLLQAAESRDPPGTQILTTQAISRLLRHSVEFSELSRHIGASVIPGLVPVLLAAQRECVLEATNCLANCMKYFPGPCGPFKFKIEQHVCELLDGSQEEPLVRAACRCYALLARCGGGGGHGVKHAEAWAIQVDKLLGSLHDTLDGVYADLETDSQVYACPGIKLGLPHVPQSDRNQKYCLQQRHGALCTALAGMMNQSFPAVVRVPAEDILGVVCRTLAITPKFLLARPTTQRLSVAAVATALHTQALTLLQTLVACLGTLLVPHCATVNKIVTQILTWSAVDEEAHGMIRPFTKLRTVAYRTLTQWMMESGASSGLESVCNEVVTHALRDAKPQRECVKLQNSGTANLEQVEHMWRKNKKKKGGGNVDLGTPTSWQQKVDSTANRGLCIASLTMLRHLMTSLGAFLKPLHHKMIQDFCASLLLELQTTPGSKVLPYCHGNVQRALYDLFLACVQHPHPSWPPPIQPAVQIFSRGQSLRSMPEVSTFCRQALLVCESLIHPPAASYSTSLTAHDVRETLAAAMATDAGAPADSGDVSRSASIALDTSEIARENPSLFQSERRHTRVRTVSESLTQGPTEDNPIDLMTSQEASSEDDDDEEEDDNDDDDVSEGGVGSAGFSSGDVLPGVANGLAAASSEAEDNVIQLDSDDSRSVRQTDSPSATAQTASHAASSRGQHAGGDDVIEVSEPEGAEGAEGLGTGDAATGSSRASTSGAVLKRKLDQLEEDDPVEEPKEKQLELMLDSFVDAEADSDGSFN